MKLAKRQKISIACNECNTVLNAENEGDLMKAKMEHMYRFHTGDFAKAIVKAVPKVKQLGEQIGRFMRENMKP